MHEWTYGQCHQGKRVSVIPGGLQGGIGPCARSSEEVRVFVAPDHALGSAGCASGVDDVDVIARAGSEVAVRLRALHDRVIGDEFSSQGAPVAPDDHYVVWLV